LTRAVKEATNTIPIVMAQDTDPVANGFVASLARPGGNFTGLSNFAPLSRLLLQSPVAGVWDFLLSGKLSRLTMERSNIRVNLAVAQSLKSVYRPHPSRSFSAEPLASRLSCQSSFSLDEKDHPGKSYRWMCSSIRACILRRRLPRAFFARLLKLSFV
jgi:ABC transporter substrate binding protein